VQQDNGAISDLSGAARPLIVKFADPQRCAGPLDDSSSRGGGTGRVRGWAASVNRVWS
jgi:hypothetical protein